MSVPSLTFPFVWLNSRKGLRCYSCHGLVFESRIRLYVTIFTSLAVFLYMNCLIFSLYTYQNYWIVEPSSVFYQEKAQKIYPYHLWCILFMLLFIYKSIFTLIYRLKYAPSTCSFPLQWYIWTFSIVYVYAFIITEGYI